MDYFGEYQILGELGRGGMAEVFLAEKTLAGGLRKQVVVKRILPHLRRHAEYAELFTREAALVLNIIHPNLVQVLDYQRVDGEDILVLEFVDGPSLADLPSGSLRDEQVAYIGAEVATGLSVLHAAEPHPILHRDVGPGNILLDRHGVVKLTDFGVACLFDDPHGERKTQARGTWRYLAPERRGGLGTYPSSDLYALGMVLAELIGGSPRVPVEMENHLCAWLDGLAAGGHEEILRTIRPLLHPDPAQRPRHAKAVAEQFRALVKNAADCRDQLALLAMRHAPSRGKSEKGGAPSGTGGGDRRRTAVLAGEAFVKAPEAPLPRLSPKIGWKAVAAASFVLLLAFGAFIGYISSDAQPPDAPPSLADVRQSPGHVTPFAFWTLDSRKPCVVSLNGNRLSQAPLRLLLPPGRHVVGCLEPDGQLSRERTVFLLPGANAETLLLP